MAAAFWPDRQAISENAQYSSYFDRGTLWRFGQGRGNSRLDSCGFRGCGIPFASFFAGFEEPRLTMGAATRPKSGEQNDETKFQGELLTCLQN
jgi:hypothetical protein